ncbi:MAG: hypothetical protein ACREJ4_01395, partial [Candidatus Methylomirabilaceae bacterium]
PDVSVEAVTAAGPDRVASVGRMKRSGIQHPNGAMLSVPARRPIKPVYVKKFVRLVEEGVAE